MRNIHYLSALPEKFTGIKVITKIHLSVFRRILEFFKTVSVATFSHWPNGSNVFQGWFSEGGGGGVATNGIISMLTALV